MKAFVFALTLLITSFATTARAGWYEYSPGWFVYGTLESNNGYAYTRYLNYCNQWVYVNGGALPAATVYHTKDWKERLTTALSEQKDTEYYLQALRESGLQPAPGTQQQQTSTYGQATYQTVTQGFTAGGSTLYGLAALPAQQGLPDLGLLIHEYQRGSDGQVQAGSQAYGQLAALIGQVGSAQTDVAKIQAAGQVAVAAIQSAQPPTTTTTAYQSTSATVPENPQPDTGGHRLGAVLPGVIGEVLVRANCASCHSGADNKTPLKLESLSSLSSADREALSFKVFGRMTTSDETKRMPKKHPAMSIQDAANVASWFKGN